MGKLSMGRARYLARQRAGGEGEKDLSVLDQIRVEGYEDYSYGAIMPTPYSNRKEAEAYRQGWLQAHLEMTGVKL